MTFPGLHQQLLISPDKTLIGDYGDLSQVLFKLQLKDAAAYVAQFLNLKILLHFGMVHDNSPSTCEVQLLHIQTIHKRVAVFLFWQGLVLGTLAVEHTRTTCLSPCQFYLLSPCQFCLLSHVRALHKMEKASMVAPLGEALSASRAHMSSSSEGM